MLFDSQINDTSVFWIDGMIPESSKLVKLLSPSSLDENGLTKYKAKLYWKPKYSGTVQERDFHYSKLLGYSLADKCDNIEVNRSIIKIFYLIPSFKLPNYRQIIKTLRNETFSPELLELVSYGPERTCNLRRKNRFRQIVGVAPLNFNLLKLIQKSLSQLGFENTSAFYRKPSWKPFNPYNDEVEYLLKNAHRAYKNNTIDNFINDLQANHNFKFHQIE